jgi:cytochrome b6-f complex iron-sulfur subunit
MKRRQFIPRAITGSAIIAVLPAILSSCEEDTVEISDPGNMNEDEDKVSLDLNDPDYSGLKDDGSYAYKSNFIVINTGSENFIALSSVCTHQGCTVNYNSSNNQLPCPCHGSVFATDGSILNGPATTSLKTYEVTREGDILKIG